MASRIFFYKTMVLLLVLAPCFTNVFTMKSEECKLPKIDVKQSRTQDIKISLPSLSIIKLPPISLSMISYQVPKTNTDEKNALSAKEISFLETLELKGSDNDASFAKSTDERWLKLSFNWAIVHESINVLVYWLNTYKPSKSLFNTLITDAFNFWSRPKHSIVLLKIIFTHKNHYIDLLDDKTIVQLLSQSNDAALLETCLSFFAKKITKFLVNEVVRIIIASGMPKADCMILTLATNPITSSLITEEGINATFDNPNRLIRSDSSGRKARLKILHILLSWKPMRHKIHQTFIVQVFEDALQNNDLETIDFLFQNAITEPLLTNF